MPKRMRSFFLTFLMYAVIVVAMVWGVPSFLAWYLDTPYPIAAITSGSMWPVLKEGDLVFIRAVQPEMIEIGDIVVWQNSRGFTIHRVVRLESDTIVTKGDANFVEDSPVVHKDIIGRAIYAGKNPLRVPYFGFISVATTRFRNQTSMQ
jgi:signal peptidase I